MTVTRGSSLVLALLASFTEAGAWCAEVGSPLIGSVASLEAGVPLDRFARVARPGSDWTSVVAAMLAGFDVVVVHPPRGLRGTDARRLSARARERGAVLLATAPWEGAALEITVTEQRWLGLGYGHGRLRAHELDVQSTGRGAAARPRRASVCLPARANMTPASGIRPLRPVVASAR